MDHSNAPDGIVGFPEITCGKALHVGDPLRLNSVGATPSRLRDLSGLLRLRAADLIGSSGGSSGISRSGLDQSQPADIALVVEHRPDL